MEDVKENKSIVTSYRLKEDTKEKLQLQLKDLGLTQEQYFNKVVSLMELENVKQNSFLSKDTTTIQSNLDAILNAFISVADSSNNLIGNKDAELQGVKSKYNDVLFNKDSIITEQKQELQQVYDEKSVLQIENDNSKNELLNIKLEYNKQFEQLEGNLKDKNLIVEEYKNKNDMLLSDLAEYKQYKTEVDQYKNLLADAQAKNMDKDNTIKNNELAIKELTTIQTQLAHEHKKELESLKKESELNIKLAVAEIKEDLNTKLTQEQQKHNAAVEEYQNKYRTLLEELEKIRSTSHSPKKKDATQAPGAK